MQNRYLKFFIVALAVAIIAPQIALAAWWNPFSWHWGWLNRIFNVQQTAQQQTLTENGVSANSLRNATLSFANPYDETKTDTFTLSNGKVLLSPGVKVVGYNLGKTAIGDLTSDKIQDGAIALYQGFGANIIRVVVFAVTNDNGKLKQLDAILPLAGQTLNTEIKSLSIKDGVLSVQLVLVSEQDQKNLPHYQWKPTVEKVIQYKLINGRLVEQSLLGGDKDSHGCIGSAGYSWCEAKQKCLRTWEEKCEADPTAGWKTYTNIQYGFEIKYPSDFERENPPNENDTLFLKVNNKNQNNAIQWIKMGIAFGMKGSYSFEDFGIDYNNKKVVSGDKNITIYKIPAISDKKSVTFVSIGSPTAAIDVTSLIQKDSNLIIVEIYGNSTAAVKDLEKLSDQMLSTFKFTK